MNNLFSLKDYMVTLEYKSETKTYTGESLYLTNDTEFSVYELSSDGQVAYRGKAINFTDSQDEVYTPQELMEYEEPCGFGEVSWDGNNFKWVENK